MAVKITPGIRRYLVLTLHPGLQAPGFPPGQASGREGRAAPLGGFTSEAEDPLQMAWFSTGVLFAGKPEVRGY